MSIKREQSTRCCSRLVAIWFSSAIPSGNLIAFRIRWHLRTNAFFCRVVIVLISYYPVYNNVKTDVTWLVSLFRTILHTIILMQYCVAINLVSAYFVYSNAKTDVIWILFMQCMRWTWYLAVDTQLHLIAPVVLIPLAVGWV